MRQYPPEGILGKEIALCNRNQRITLSLLYHFLPGKQETENLLKLGINPIYKIEKQ